MRRPREELDETHGGLSDDTHRAVAPKLETPNTFDGDSTVESPGINPFTHQPFSPQYYKLLAQRTALPVYRKRDLLIERVRENQVVLLVGETGSGKTTQVPHFIGEMGFPGIVACTQPRRIAATSVAIRVATEMDVRLGEEVGYHVRFQSMMSLKTKVLYMTDGMLLREVFSDHDLSKFSVVVVDEAHERTVDTDVLLGVLRLLLERRPEFRIVVMSATLDMDKFLKYFPKAPMIKVEGRMFDVSVQYTTLPVKDYIETCVDKVCEIHMGEQEGDILCFLTGEAEIERALNRTRAKLGHLVVSDKDQLNSNDSEGTNKSNDSKRRENENGCQDRKEHMLALVLPLYGSLSMDDQKRVFVSPGKNTRKIIYATNIAETSLTIDGIVYVVDCGYHKQSLYNAEVRVDYLLPALISKASAEQRKGRAGRTRPGKCFRMFSREDLLTFPDQTHPEILRSSLVDTLLLLLKLEVSNPYQFAFIDPPSQQNIADAYYQLNFFGAVDDDLRLTKFGQSMAEFPVSACLARMLLRSEEYRCGADAAIIAAMLEAGNVFARPATRLNEAEQQHSIFHHRDGDHLTLFNVFHGFWRSGQSVRYCHENFLRYQAMAQAARVYIQLTKLMTRKGISVVSTYDDKSKTMNSELIRKTVLEGFFTQIAYKPPSEDRYKTAKDSSWVSLHRQSSLSKGKRPSWIVYDRLEIQGKEGTFIRMASAVEPQWLLAFSDFFGDFVEMEDTEIGHILQTLAAETKR